MGLFLDKTEHSTWQQLLVAMPDKEFRNATRSSLPLLAYWKQRVRDQSKDYHFEYTVPSVPRARPSHTDLMVIGTDEATAVEGKSTEPRYECVRDWSAKSGALRETALAHWVDLVTSVTGSDANDEDLDRCVYQMVHRLASLCFVDRPSRTLAYQVFDVGGDHDFYRDDLWHLTDTFSLAGIIDVVFIRVETSLTDEGQLLQRALPGMDPVERAVTIRQALLDGRLFKFGEEKTEVITSA